MSTIGFRTSDGLADITTATIDSSYSSTLSLALVKNIGCGGVVSWVDMGAEYDTLKSKLNVEILNSGDNLIDFENNLKGSTKTITPVISDAIGFYPLTPLYSNCGGVANQYELSLINAPQPKSLMVTGKAVQYAFEVIPNSTTLTLASAYPSCGKYSGWTLDGLDLPYTTNVPKGRLNTVNKSAQLNSGAYNPQTYKREFGEAVKVSVHLDEEKTRQLLAKLKAVRGSQFDIVTPLNYNYFAHLYPTNTSFKCILSSNKVAVKVENHKNITVSFSIQLQAVNS